MDCLACNKLHNVIPTISVPSFFKRVEIIKANTQSVVITTTYVQKLIKIAFILKATHFEKLLCL
jgi:hypothetical protein